MKERSVLFQQSPGSSHNSKNEFIGWSLIVVFLSFLQFILQPSSVTWRLTAAIIVLGVSFFVFFQFFLDSKLSHVIRNKIGQYPLSCFWVMTLIVFFFFIFLQGYLYYFDDIGDGNINSAYYGNYYWNTLNGKWLYSSAFEENLFAHHVSLGYFFFLPFYAIYQNMFFLIILQDIVLLSTFFLIFKLFRHLLTLFQSLTLILALMFYTPMIGWSIKEFEPSVIACPFIVLLFYFYREEKKIPAFLVGFILCLVKENMSLVPFSFGLLALVEKKSFHWWGPLIAFSCLYALIVPFGVATKLSLNGEYFNSAIFLSKDRFSADFFFSLLSGKRTWEYLIKIFLPMGILLFKFGRFWLLFLPSLGINLFLNHDIFNVAENHYHFHFAILILLSLFVQVRNKVNPSKVNLYLAAVLFLIFANFRFSWPGQRLFWLPQKQSTREEVLRLIPPDSSVMIHGRFYNKLCHRADIKIWQINFRKELISDFLIFDTTYHPLYLEDEWEKPKQMLKEVVEEIERGEIHYKKVFDKDGILVYQKNE